MVRAGAVEILEHGASLLSKSVRDGHDALRVALAAFALRPVGCLAPEDEGSQVAFGQVVGRVDVVAVDEGPEGLSMIEDIGARSAEAAGTKACAALEEVLHACSDRLHPSSEGPSRHGAVSHAMPVVKDDLGGPLQLPGDLRACAL